MTTFLAVVISAGIWLLLIREKDSIEKEPLWVLIKTVIKGGVLSIILLSVIYIPFYFIMPSDFFQVHTLGKGSFEMKFVFAMYVGIVEETAKAWAAIILTNKLKEFDEPVDGMIYGMAVALGFAAIENIEYVLKFSVNVIYIRSTLSMPLHIACGGIWGYGLALNRFRYQRLSKLWNLYPYILAAAFAHGIYDFICFSMPDPWMQIILVATITLVTYRWAVTRSRKLAAISPFLEEGECGKCRTLNGSDATVCKKCGREIPDRGEFYDGEGEK